MPPRAIARPRRDAPETGRALRFLLSGYYGFGNLGDDALLQIIVAQLKTRYPHASIDVLSAQPEVTAHDLNVEATPRADLGAVRRSIERADVVLSGGGGLLQNATSLKSLIYYAGIIRGAIRAERRAMIFAQSVGPLDFWGKQTVRECCRGLTAATVRDERSREMLQPLVAPEVRRTADPVFLYDPPADPPAVEAGLGPESDPLVVVCVRKTARFTDGVQAIASAVDHLSEKYGARAAFIPFGGQADAEAATVIIRKCRSKPALLPLEGLDRVARAIAGARLLIGVRLHALILAARFGVPFLAIPYDPKVLGLMEDLDYPLAPLWSPSGETPGGIEAVVGEAWQRRDALSAHLEGRLPALRAAAAENFTVLEAALAR